MQQIDNIAPAIQQLVWTNRNEQQKVFANTKRGSDGSFIINQTKVTSGIPVTIGTLDGWMERDDFTALQAHNEVTLDPFTITMGDDVMQVVWDNTDGVAITGQDLYPDSNGHTLLTNVLMKFLTV